MKDSIDGLDENLPDESPLDDNELSKTQRGDEKMGDGLDGEEMGEPEEEERTTARFEQIENVSFGLLSSIVDHVVCLN